MGSFAAHPGGAKPDPVLVVSGLQRRFGGIVAVDVDHLEIQRGLITAIIGPNGAGKTTFFNVLTGFERSDQGSWSFDGRPIHGLSPHRIVRRGMVRTFQLTKTLAKMSVLENVMLAAPDQRGERIWSAFVRPLWMAQENDVRERAEGLIARVGLTALRDDYAGTLSGGQRKLLELARALMVEPRVLMLDEPMAGVNPALVESLLDHIVTLRDEGRTVVFIEHDMDVVQRISDWLVVMAEGQVIAEGPPRETAADPVVIDAYLGRPRTSDSSGAEVPE
ncbi:MAG: ABC transporter ATP-binding protein [Ilumatobacteraceae bacterium]